MTAPDESLLNVAVGGSVSGVIGTTGDTDDASVFLVAGQTYSVSLRGTGANAVRDTFLQVYDPSAVLLKFDDDGGNDRFSLLTFTAAVTGNFTIRASSFTTPGDPGTGGYTVDVRVQGADAVGDTNATAVVLGQGTTFGFRETATVSGGADLDRYEVTLEAGKFYTFKVAAGADYATDYTAVPAGEIDTILRLRNDAGTLLAQNDDNKFPSDISSGFGFLATVSGTYYLDVTGYSGQTGGYVIDFQEIDYKNMDPLDAIRWESADDIDTVTVGSQQVAYVYFGLVGETFGESITTFGWNTTEKAAVMNALLEFTKITGITYLETTDVSQAEFRLNTVSTGDFAAYSYPQDPIYGAQQGILIFNVNNSGWDKPGVSTQDVAGDQLSLNKGGFAYATILHEFGLVHGLAHPHADEGGSDVMLGVTSDTNSYGLFNLNQGVYTIMSHNEAWDLHPDGPSPFTIAGIGSGWSGTLAAFDIAVLQERYGVHAYNTGNNVYTLASVQQTGVYYETIWDSGGTDSIVYDGTGNATIDLTPASLDYSPTGAGALSFVDQIPGTAGVDGIFGGYTIANGVVIENAYGGSGNDTLTGNDGVNLLNGRGGIDTLNGRGGNDLLYVDNAGDVVIEGAGGGTDRVLASVSYALGAAAQVEIFSTTDNVGTTAITLIGNGFAQAITGNDGANTLIGGAGADTLNGRGGNDLLYVDNAGDVVVEAAGGGTDRVLASVSYALGAAAQVEIFSTTDNVGTTAINLIGNGFAQAITGNDGANTLIGGAGADTLNGRGGNDLLYVDNAGDVVVEAAGGGTDRVLASVSYTLGAAAQVEIFSTTDNVGTGAINLIGNGFDQAITGNDGANLLNGGAGADTLNGRGGNDLLYVDNAGDVVVEGAGGGTDRVLASVSYTLGSAAQVEILSTTNNLGTGAINLAGNGFAQAITGNNGANLLNGGAGADTLNGLGGNDLLYVDNAGDVVIEVAGGGTDRVLASVSYTLGAAAQVEVFSTTNNAGTGAINLTGNGFAQGITGNAGANVLDGGAGTDTLNGLGGTDTFRFTTALGAGNIDTISGYSVADDVIHIDNAVFTGLAAGALAAGAFNTGAAASQADDRIIYNAATGALLFDADGNGAGAAVQFAVLSAGLAMTASEFLVI